MKRRFASTTLSLIACVGLACGDDGSGDGDTTGSTGHGTSHETDVDPDTSAGSSGTPTSAGSSSGAADSTGGSDSSGEPADIDVVLPFAVRIGEDDVVCGQTYDGIGLGDTSVELLDLRFFVSNVRLVDDTGEEVPLVLENDDEWQLDGSAMLDFEDGSGGCTENTTAATNTTLRGTAPAGTYEGVRFDLGLPFDQNHLNADIADPPLNTTAMFWNWAAGYKFVKIDLQNDNAAPGNRWNFHLGSQACDNGKAGPTMPPTEECGRPGRPAIEVMGFDPTAGTVVLDLAALYAEEDVSADTPKSAPGCMSFMPDINECDGIYPRLGLDWATGDCVDGCSGQNVFSGE